MRWLSTAKWRGRVKRLKEDLPALYYAWLDPRVPLLSKSLLVCALVYLLSPIDIVPDVIPLAGYLDDLVVVPLLISLAIRLIPETVMAECRVRGGKEGPLKVRYWPLVLAFLTLLAIVLSLRLFLF